MLLGAAGEQPSAHVRDGSAATFQADVLEASAERPVIVEFHAGAHLGLEPIIAKLDGAVDLVRIDARAETALVDQLRIQSCPSVMAFVDRHFAAGFSGRADPAALQAFIGELTGAEVDEDAQAMMEAARQAMAAGDIAAAAQAFAAVIQADPDEAEAVAGLARCQWMSGHAARAKDVLSMLGESQKRHPAVVSIEAAIALCEEAGETEPSGDDDDPAAAAHGEAVAALRGGKLALATDKLLASIEIDREWRGGAARKTLLRVFEALGPEAPETIAGRRRLSSILFS